MLARVCDDYVMRGVTSRTEVMSGVIERPITVTSGVTNGFGGSSGRTIFSAACRSLHTPRPWRHASSNRPSRNIMVFGSGAIASLLSFDNSRTITPT